MKHVHIGGNLLQMLGSSAVVHVIAEWNEIEWNQEESKVKGATKIALIEWMSAITRKEGSHKRLWKGVQEGCVVAWAGYMNLTNAGSLRGNSTGITATVILQGREERWGRKSVIWHLSWVLAITVVLGQWTEWGSRKPDHYLNNSQGVTQVTQLFETNILIGKQKSIMILIHQGPVISDMLVVKSASPTWDVCIFCSAMQMVP